MDAYALSWTTFSTVVRRLRILLMYLFFISRILIIVFFQKGYGMVYPQISVNERSSDCMIINTLMAIESFVGVLYGALCGAILFGKILRIQAFANVMFSDTLVVKYGEGLEDDMHIDASNSLLVDRLEQNDNSVSPFPVMEFRVVNQMHHKNGGEILNSKVTAIAAIRESKASKYIKLAADPHRRESLMQRHQESIKDLHRSFSESYHKEVPRPTKKTRLSNLRKSILEPLRVNPKALSVQLGDTIQPKVSENWNDDEDEIPLEQIINERFLLDEAGAVPHSLIDEGSPLVPRRIFSPIKLETSQHPSFNSVWIVRHVLNERSPMLNGLAKRMITSNGGHWPAELNNWQKVREYMHFHELIVSFTGTSNASGGTVYRQKLYDISDLNVGYTFVEMSHRNKRTGRLEHDEALVSDIVEQIGGGAEPYLDDTDGRKGLLERATGGISHAAEEAVHIVTHAGEKIEEGFHAVGDTIQQGFAKANSTRNLRGPMLTLKSANALSRRSAARKAKVEERC